MLTADHREVERLLKRLGDADESEQAELVHQVDSSLRLHMKIEEQLLYPIVEQELGRQEAEEAEVEHKLARQGLDQLQQFMGVPGFGAAVEMLKAGIQHHVHEEETEMFPQLSERLDERQRAALGDSIAEAKAAGSIMDKDTKDELLEAARARDIPGRSTMTKDELRAALGAT